VKTRKILLGIAAAGVAISLSACGGSRVGTSDSGDGDNAGALIGVAMPTQTSERWIDDGDNVKAKLEKLGYKVDLQYANDQVEDQISQIEAMVNKGAKALIVASIDGTALSNVLQTAADDGIKVIAYDRLINETENVDYYVSFDNEKVGIQQGTSLLTGLGLLDADGNPTGDTTPKTIEIFAGSPDDNNARYFFDGAMSVIQPFIDSGQITVGSGQTDFTQVAIQQWKLEGAQARMENLLGLAYNSGQTLDGVLAPYDGLSRGILNALETGYDGTTPVITGQDAEKASDRLILEGTQYSTIFKDTRLLGNTAAEMVDALLTGGEPETNDTTTYDNGVKVVPAFLHESVIITKDNLVAEVVDSGYYTQDEVDKGE
jgi:putative multiple sugar transport system substrate-binding protein